MADARKCRGCKHHGIDTHGMGMWCAKCNDWCSYRNKRGLCKYYEASKGAKDVTTNAINKD